MKNTLNAPIKSFHSFRPLLFSACWLAAHACSMGNHEAVSVKTDPPHTSVKYVDEIYWPQKSAFGRAYTDWAFLCRPEISIKELPELHKEDTYVFEVTGVQIHLQLEMTETLPIGVKQPLRKHEDMHCQMTSEVYKAAPQAALEIAREMLGKKIIVNAATNLNAAKAAAKLDARTQVTTAFKQRVSYKADALAVIFDRVTRHGMNGVSNEEGSRLSFAEYEKNKADAKNKDGQAELRRSEENIPETKTAAVKQVPPDAATAPVTPQVPVPEIPPPQVAAPKAAPEGLPRQVH